MSHLSTDRLAALDDEEPTPAEATHLASCAECAHERSAYRTLVAMAHVERDTIALPLTRWDAIAGALNADQPQPAARQLTLDPATQPTQRVVPRRFSRLPLQAAAAILLVASGVIAGRMSAGTPALPGASTIASTQAPTADSGETPVANAADAHADSVSFVSIDDARQAQLRSEAIYQQAAAFLAQHDTTGAGDGSPVAYRSRLAALDQVLSTTREAMREAPHDPVINGYYLTTLGQREATLRQLNTVLPASLRANSF
jgi:hypothetical protein